MCVHCVIDIQQKTLNELLSHQNSILCSSINANGRFPELSFNLSAPFWPQSVLSTWNDVGEPIVRYHVDPPLAHSEGFEIRTQRKS